MIRALWSWFSLSGIGGVVKSRVISCCQKCVATVDCRLSRFSCRETAMKNLNQHISSTLLYASSSSTYDTYRRENSRTLEFQQTKNNSLFCSLSLVNITMKNRGWTLLTVECVGVCGSFGLNNIPSCYTCKFFWTFIVVILQKISLIGSNVFYFCSVYLLRGLPRDPNATVFFSIIVFETYKNFSSFSANPASSNFGKPQSNVWLVWYPPNLKTIRF